MTVYFIRDNDSPPPCEPSQLSSQLEGYLDPENKPVELHAGPGNHPIGSSQKVHGGGGGSGESITEAIRGSILEKAIAGGFSYQPFTQEYPDSGYMYSIWGDREKQIPIEEVTSAALEEYIIANADLLTQENHYFGGWVEDGILYLDVSKRNESLEEALAEANEFEQLGIFDLNEMETIYTDFYHNKEKAKVEERVEVEVGV